MARSQVSHIKCWLITLFVVCGVYFTVTCFRSSSSLLSSMSEGNNRVHGYSVEGAR